MVTLLDHIIAYFDHRLSDAESADLLHEVSGDPDKLRQFKDHENLRARIERAKSNVSVRPKVEDDLFSRIAQIQKSERLPLKAAARSFRMRAAMAGLGTIAAAVLVKLAVFGSPGAMHNTAQVMPSDSRPQSAEATLTPHVSSSVAADRVAILTKHNRALPGVAHASTAIALSRDEAHPVVAHASQSEESATTDGLLLNAPVRSLGGPSLNAASASMLSTMALPVDEHPSWEFSLSGESGTLHPSGIHDLWVVSGLRSDIGYFISHSSLVGIRVSGFRTHSEFDSKSTSTIAAGSTPSHLESHDAMKLAGEIYVEHRLPLLEGRLQLSGSLSAGLMPDGNFVSAELGVQLPIFSRVLAGLSFAFSRTQSSAGSIQANSTNADLSRWHSPYGARVLYGVSYQL